MIDKEVKNCMNHHERSNYTLKTLFDITTVYTNTRNWHTIYKKNLKKTTIKNAVNELMCVTDVQRICTSVTIVVAQIWTVG